jgi:hypothetical protein
MSRRFSSPLGSNTGPIPGQRLGFQNTTEVTATRGVKLRNKNAEKKEQEKLDKEEYIKKFDQAADNLISYNEDKTKRTVGIISKFLRLAEDKTLSKNKGSIAIDVEKEIRQDVIQIALDLNNDETEEDNGKGSVVVITALIKIILSQRDRLNDLEYENQLIKQEIVKINPQSSQTLRQFTNANK